MITSYIIIQAVLTRNAADIVYNDLRNHIRGIPSNKKIWAYRDSLERPMTRKFEKSNDLGFARFLYLGELITFLFSRESFCSFIDFNVIKRTRNDVSVYILDRV